MICLHFMRRSEAHSLKDINVEERKKWIPLNDIFPGILACETIKIMLPHERESFPAAGIGIRRQCARFNRVLTSMIPSWLPFKIFISWQ